MTIEFLNSKLDKNTTVSIDMQMFNFLFLKITDRDQYSSVTIVAKYSNALEKNCNLLSVLNGNAKIVVLNRSIAV